MLHIHHSHFGRDCDGPLSRYSVTSPGGWGRTADQVMRRLVASYHHECADHNGEVRRGSYCDQYEHQRTVTITPLLAPVPEEDDPWPTTTVEGWIVTTSAPHEEGGSSEEYIICKDPTCRIGERSQRDYFAEAAGY